MTLDLLLLALALLAVALVVGYLLYLRLRKIAPPVEPEPPAIPPEPAAEPAAEPQKMAVAQTEPEASVQAGETPAGAAHGHYLIRGIGTWKRG